MYEYYPELQTLISEYATREEAVRRVRELSGVSRRAASDYIRHAGVQFPRRLCAQKRESVVE